MSFAVRFWFLALWQAFVLPGAPDVLAAQDAAPSREPAAIMERFLWALLRSQWREAAQLLDSTSLQQARRDVLNTPERWGPPYIPTVDDLMRDNPRMPRAVAEYLAQDYLRTAQLRPPVVEFGLDSVAQLARLSIEDLGVAWVKARDFAHQVRQSAERDQCPVPQSLDSTLRARQPIVYGAVFRDSTRAFVLFQLGPTPRTVPEGHAILPQIATLRRGPAGWRVEVREGLVGMGGWFSVCTGRG